MIRIAALGSHVLAPVALTLAVGAAACSSGPDTTGGGFGDNVPVDNGAQTGSGDNGAGGGSQASSGSAGSSGGQTSGGSGGASASGSSGHSSGATASGSTGSSGGGASSGNSGTSGTSGGATSGGVTGTPATDLAPPAAGTGIQLATPDYNPSDPNASQLIVQPGQEIFLCYYVTLPNTSEMDVGAFESWMSSGSSHHFIVYQAGTGLFSVTQPSGTIQSCAVGTGTWIYATSTPGEVIGMTMPPNVGYPLPAGTQLILNMHFINPGTTVLYPKVKFNILYANNVQYKAAAMVSFNTKINVPPATAAGPGTQTVSGTCTAPVGSKFFLMSTHTHKHATAAVVDYVSGGKSTEIVHTGTASTYPADQEPNTGTDWEHPGVGTWSAPSFLTVNAGDSFTYSCTYENTGTTAVTVGETAASNEMCMAVGYYFPAGTSSCN